MNKAVNASARVYYLVHYLNNGENIRLRFSTEVVYIAGNQGKRMKRKPGRPVKAWENKGHSVGNLKVSGFCLEWLQRASTKNGIYRSHILERSLTEYLKKNFPDCKSPDNPQK